MQCLGKQQPVFYINLFRHYKINMGILPCFVVETGSGQFQQTFKTHGTTDGGRGFAAELFNDAIETTSRAYGAQCAQAGGSPFKDGLAVVVQTPDQAGIDNVADSGVVERRPEAG